MKNFVKKEIKMEACGIGIATNVTTIHTRTCNPRRPAGCQVTEMKFLLTHH